ncbi:MAG: hypothetical protein ACYDAO_06040 [Thermoplasmataceae archaeon]
MRKRTGNLATGRLLSRNGDKLAIFQNLGLQKYMEVVFGTTSAASRFGSYRKELREKSIRPMTRKMVVELVDKGKKDLVSGKLRKDPYSDETMELANSARNTEMKQGSRDGMRAISLLPP